ncbi:hypothetical protein D3C73_1055650 [compost metagenome]
MAGEAQRITHDIIHRTPHQFGIALDGVIHVRAGLQHDVYAGYLCFVARIAHHRIHQPVQVEILFIRQAVALGTRQRQQFADHFIQPPRFVLNALQRILYVTRILPRQANR